MAAPEDVGQPDIQTVPLPNSLRAFLNSRTHDKLMLRFLGRNPPPAVAKLLTALPQEVSPGHVMFGLEKRLAGDVS